MSDADGDKIDRLERLAALRERGLLSSEEFAAEKAKILTTVEFSSGEPGLEGTSAAAGNIGQSQSPISPTTRAQPLPNALVVSIVILLAMAAGVLIIWWMRVDGDHKPVAIDAQQPAATAGEAAPTDQPAATADASEPKTAVFPDGPNFSSFPAEAFKGKVVYPDFAGKAKSAADFHTRITEAVKEGPRFAGNIAVAEFGCGAACRSGYLINVQTGDVYDLPVGGEDQPLLEIKYKLTSRLFEAQWADSSFNPTTCSRQFFEWTGSAFRPMPKQDAAGDCPEIEH